MWTVILGAIVAFFASKYVASFLTKVAIGLADRGVTDAGKKVQQTMNEVFDKPPTSVAMAGFVVNTEDFGKVVFGSEDKLIDAVSMKVIDAVHEKLETEKGRKEVAKRLSKVSKAR